MNRFLSKKAASAFRVNILPFVVIIFFSISSNCQSTHDYEVLFTVAYSNFHRAYKQPETTYKGSYGLGLEFRYLLGSKENLIRPRVGLALSLAQQNARTVPTNLAINVPVNIRTSYFHLGIPVAIAFDNGTWRSSLQVALESPFYVHDQFTYEEYQGAPSVSSGGGNFTKILVDFGLGFGANLGRSFTISDNRTLVLEAQFRSFNNIRPLKSHDEFSMDEVFPYWTGLMMGMGF